MNKHPYKRFDSVGALFDSLPDESPVERALSRRTSDPDFYGSTDFDQAKDYATSGGWDGAGQQAADAVAAVLSSIRDTVQPQPERLFANTGYMPNVPMFVAGNPAHMIQHIPNPRAGRAKTVRIVVNIGALGFIAGSTMIRRGVAYVALCEVLASLGYSTDVWAVSSCQPSNGRRGVMSVAWNIKPSSGVIDRDRLVYNLANPGNLRRMAWAVRETFTEAERKHFGISPGAGYGASAVVDQPVLNDLRPDVVADAPLTRDDQVGDPVAFVIDTLRGLDLIG
jgi:hypothetical protein